MLVIIAQPHLRLLSCNPKQCFISPKYTTTGNSPLNIICNCSWLEIDLARPDLTDRFLSLRLKRSFYLCILTSMHIYHIVGVRVHLHRVVFVASHAHMLIGDTAGGSGRHGLLIQTLFAAMFGLHPMSGWCHFYDGARSRQNNERDTNRAASQVTPNTSSICWWGWAEPAKWCNRWNFGKWH